MSKNRGFGWPELAAGTFVVGLFLGYSLVRPWVYRTFPTTCPYGAYLPETSTVTACDYRGFVDQIIKFEAAAPREDVEGFVTKIMDDLTDPRISETFDGINGNDLPGHYYADISEKRLKHVLIDWYQDKLTMTYLDR